MILLFFIRMINSHIALRFYSNNLLDFLRFLREVRFCVNYPSPKGNGLGRLSQKEPISVLQRPCIGSFCIFSFSNYGRIFLYHRKNFYSRTSSHWSMFPKCTACRLSTSTSCGKLFLMIMTPFSLSCFSPPPAMPPMVRSSVKTVPSL